MEEKYEKVLMEIKRQKYPTIQSLSKALGISRLTVARYLAYLEGMGKIRVIKVGRAKIIEVVEDEQTVSG